MKVRPAALAFSLGLIILLAYCGEDSLARARRSGILRVGYAVEAPYAFVGERGEVTGESPELAKLIAARIGIKRIEWRQLEFDSLLPELQAGSVDLVAAGLFVTEERARRVAFSLPTFRVWGGLLVQKGNPRGLHSYRDLVAAGEGRVACLAGAVEREALREAGLPDSRIVLVPDAVSGRAAVASGLVLALALSEPTVHWMAMQDGGRSVETAEPFSAFAGGPSPLGAANGAFAFRRADRSLLKAWNAALGAYVGSPEHLALVSPFGFTAANLPERSSGAGKSP